jgi:hypothetical protein
MDELWIEPGTEGVDYSYARPNLAQLWAEGQRFLVRYVRSPFDHPKVLSPLEADASRAQGFGLLPIFELDKYRPLGGTGAGLIDGTLTREYCRLLGFAPAVSRLVAIDIDTTGINAWIVRRYLEGFASGASPDPWGCYGDYDAIELALQLGSTLNIQAAARSWSRSIIHPEAHIIQGPELWAQLDYSGRPSDGATDSLLALRPFITWGPAVPQPPTPIPQPPYFPELETYYMPATPNTAQMIRDRRYSVVLLVGAGMPEWLTGERVEALAAAGVPMVVEAAHPSFPILAARAGVPNLDQYPAT